MRGGVIWLYEDGKRNSEKKQSSVLLEAVAEEVLLSVGHSLNGPSTFVLAVNLGRPTLQGGSFSRRGRGCIETCTRRVPAHAEPHGGVTSYIGPWMSWGIAEPVKSWPGAMRFHNRGCVEIVGSQTGSVLDLIRARRVTTARLSGARLLMGRL